MRGPRPRPPAERFWEKVCRTNDEKECWLWSGGIDTAGYGQFNLGSRRDGSRRNARAHRVAWKLTYGPIPDGLYVCHRCDVRPCCNPTHLWLSDHNGNMADMVSKGRARSGQSGRGHGAPPIAIVVPPESGAKNKLGR